MHSILPMRLSSAPHIEIRRLAPSGHRRGSPHRPSDLAAPDASPTCPSSATPARVLEVVDGDTIVVGLGGKQFRVRYIGIDAPEMHDPATGRPEPYARSAKFANERLTLGRIVYLEPDVSDCDRHGRLLRYVWLDEKTMLNAELARLGYARVNRYEPDTRHQDFLEAIEQKVRKARRGIWSLSD
ncbi:MAG: thermonuclease family protein [Anaerolineae bacterium]